MITNKHGSTEPTVTAAINKILSHTKNNTAKTLAVNLVSMTLRTKLRFAMEEFGLKPPAVIEVGELLQFPGIARSGYQMGWCLLLPYHALFGDFDTGAVIEVNVYGVRRYRKGGAR